MERNPQGRQPAASNAASVYRSRSRFRVIFADQNAVFDFGIYRWSAHPCQKQPSTKTATLRRGNAMSIALRSPERGRTWTR